MMIGQTISHYKISEKLGEGGMGVVYKAEDTKLKRTVALKFLPKGLEAHEPERARFLQEAQAASALNHPNICTIHDLQDYEGQQFIVMEFVDGQALRYLKPETLKLEAVLSYAIQIGEALQEAHSHGIVHRDVKPENIMVNTKNQIKVMDFGLAKLKGSLKLTKTSSTVGTLAYMAPEQIQGEAVDARVDIFSFGIVLYEMITGHLPFRGEHETAIMYSILNEEPQPIYRYRQDIPPNVTSIILKALQKEPSSRYQTIQEMIKDLKDASVKSVKSNEEDKSIAVLPFENMSADQDQEYFSDGLTEEVISDLCKVHSLRVISRSSIMTFKGTKKKVPDIARELNVQYLLEGSVRKAGNSLRITAQLIDAMNDTHLWAEKYSGTLDDVFDIQEKVSRSIVDALKLKLTPEEKKKMREKPINDIAAYECYLKAIQENYRFSTDALDRALQYLHDALKRTGENAHLFSALAFTHYNCANMGIKPDENLVKAEEYVTKALALDPDFPKAHVVIGMIKMFGEPKGSIPPLKRALQGNPDDIDALIWLSAAYFQYSGKTSAAAPLIHKIVLIDPLNPMTYQIKGAFELFRGEFNLALEDFRKNHQMDPLSIASMFCYAWSLAYLGKYDKAIAIADETEKKFPDQHMTRMTLLLKYAVLKDREKAFQQFTPNFERINRIDGAGAHMVADMLSLLGAKEESLDWLEQAVNRGFINYPFLSEKDTLLENIRGEARFKKLMERVKKQWEELVV